MKRLLPLQGKDAGLRSLKTTRASSTVKFQRMLAFLMLRAPSQAMLSVASVRQADAETGIFSAPFHKPATVHFSGSTPIAEKDA